MLWQFSRLYPYYVVHDTALQETSLFTFLTLLAVIVVQRSARTGELQFAALGGLLLGLDVLTRATIAPFAALAALWLIGRRRTGGGLLCALILAFTVSPWLVVLQPSNLPMAQRSISRRYPIPAYGVYRQMAKRIGRLEGPAALWIQLSLGGHASRHLLLGSRRGAATHRRFLLICHAKRLAHPDAGQTACTLASDPQRYNGWQDHLLFAARATGISK
jgi:hypothetical protein